MRSRKSDLRSSTQKEQDKREWDDCPAPSRDVFKKGEAYTPYSNRSRKMIGTTPRSRNVYSVRKKSMKVNTPLRFDQAVDELDSTSRPVLAFQAFPPAEGQAQFNPQANVVPAVNPRPAESNKVRESVTPEESRESRESQSPESNNSEEEQLDRIEGHTAIKSKKKRTVAHHLWDSDREHETQHDAEDRPSPKKKRKTKQKVRRRIPVNELVTGPERVEAIVDPEQDIRESIVDDNVSQGSSPDIKPRRAQNHQRAKEGKGKRPSRKEPKELVSIKYSQSKGFQIDIKKFQNVKLVARSATIDSRAASDGFSAAEMKFTGKTLPTKRHRGKCTIQYSIGPQGAPRVKQLTIVAEEPSGNDADSSNMKKSKTKFRTLSQKQPEAHLKITQNSGIATPPTIHKKSKPPTVLASIAEVLSIALQNAEAAILEHSDSNTDLPQSPLFRQNVESNSKQAQSKIAKPSSLLRAQRDKEDSSSVIEELSMVIITKHSDSNSDETSEEGDQESESNSGESDEGDESDRNTNADDEVVVVQFGDAENNENSNADRPNVENDDVILDLEGNEIDQSEKENQEVVDEEDVDEEIEPQLHEEDEKGSEQGLENAPEQVSVDEAEQEESELEARYDGQVEARQEIELEEEVDEDDHPPPWQPRKPDTVVETEDEIQSSSPVRPLGRSYRNAFRTSSRIYPPLPAVLENALNPQPSQGSLELGDSQFRRPKEIPETQMSDIEEEPEVPFSQISYHPNSSYFDRASQSLQQPPRKLSSRTTKGMPPPRIDQYFRTPSFGGSRQTVSRQQSLMGSGGKSLKDITNRTNSQFGIQGSAQKRRTYSVGLLSQTFRV